MRGFLKQSTVLALFAGIVAPGFAMACSCGPNVSSFGQGGSETIVGSVSANGGSAGGFSFGSTSGQEKAGIDDNRVSSSQKFSSGGYDMTYSNGNSLSGAGSAAGTIGYSHAYEPGYSW